MPRHNKKHRGTIHNHPVEKLRKFQYFRKIWHKIFGYRVFLKAGLKSYHAVHNKVVDRILFSLYKHRSASWLPFFAGILAGFAQPPVYAFPLLPFAFVILVRTMDFAKKPMDFFKISALFNVGFSIIALYWPGYGTYIFGFPVYAMVCFGIGIVLLSAVIPTIIIGIFGIIGLRLQMFRRIFLFASMWVIAEYLRGFTIFNFPFAFVGYSVGFWAPLFQSASIFGVLGVSFLLIVWSLSFYPILFSQDKIQFIGIFRRFVLVQCVFIFIIISGVIRVYNAKTEYYPHKVALVQGNGSVSNDIHQNYEIYSKMTYKMQQLTGGDIDMIIWPEGVDIPYDLDKNPFDALKFASFISSGQTFVFNTIRTHGSQLYNTMYSYTMPHFEMITDINGTQKMAPKINHENHLIYHDKKYLVPYGEYIPFIGNFGIGKAIARGAGVGFTAGKKINIMETAHGKILPLICYEITYSGKFGIAKGLKADYIINTTNDEWFGRSSGPYQHFVAAQYRAVEEGLPVVRVSNNGFSAIIDAYGQVNSKRTKLFERDVIISLIPKKAPFDTLFDFVGNIPLMLFAYLYTYYFFGVYYFYKHRDKISKHITSYVEEKDRKKKDPKYIRRF
jgi:apolipoprotein N-acyltransferase